MAEIPKQPTPPKEIRVGYKKLRVLPVRTFNNTDPTYADQLGEFDRAKNTIKYKVVPADDENVNTILHEVLHACFYIYGLGVMFPEDTDEEMIVNTLTNALTDVFKANPKFLDYIKEGLA